MLKKQTNPFRTPRGFARKYKRESAAWNNMHIRIYNKAIDPNNPQAKCYVGVNICNTWLRASYGGQGNFVHFVKTLGPMPDDGNVYVLDRIDPAGDYTPENCQWLTKEENDMKARSRGYGNGKSYRVMTADDKLAHLKWLKKEGATPCFIDDDPNPDVTLDNETVESNEQ